MNDVSATGNDHPEDGERDEHAERLAAERDAMRRLGEQPLPSGTADAQQPPSVPVPVGAVGAASPVTGAGPAPGVGATDEAAAAARAGARVPAQNRPGHGPGPGQDPSFSDLVPWLPDPGPVARRFPVRPATRRPAIGLTAAIALTLAAAFFGWVSSQPFWLSAGFGSTGTATIVSCDRTGDAACMGHFRAAGSEFITYDVVVNGVAKADRRTGATVPARMLRPDSDWAYAGSLGIRWKIGLLAALLCCALVPLATGVRRLRTENRAQRLAVWAVGFAGPLVVVAGILVAALV